MIVCGLLLLSLAGWAHVRLIHPINQAPLYWSSPANIGVTISSTGSDDIPDGSDEVALRMAIEEWNTATGTSARLVEDTRPLEQARTDWQANDIHLIYFDENNSSDFFPPGSSTVAVTPVFFQGAGNIVDADILYNGGEWNFSTSGQVGRFDVGDVGVHELGHLLGLNHSAFIGSSMYPYVDPSVLLHRSVSEDDIRGLRDAYPSGSYGRITGTVMRLSSLFPVAGAYVVATESTTGRTAASILTDTNGNFTLPGMDPGTYEVYAVPLGSPGVFGDSPVDINNLGGGYFIETDFEPAVYLNTATITTTETVPLGTLLVDADVQVNLGTSSDRFPLRITAGESTNLILRGTGLFSSPIEFSCSDPDILVSSPSFFATQVNFQVTVPAGETPGHVDLTYVNSAGDLAILPAALEITYPTPTVTHCVPSSGARAGGTNLTISGTNFRPVARIVIGDRIYTDGVGGVTVVDSTTITLATLATSEGTHDVVVFDESGLDGRLASGFQSQNVPMVAAVFPIAGEFSGGTTVTITGQDFQDGVVARIDGVTQGPVNFVDSSRISFTTMPGPVGGPYTLELENPDMGIATSLFTFAAGPDPGLSTIDPPTGSAAGGEMLILTGSNFGRFAHDGTPSPSFAAGSTTVLFGVDPLTGLGGTAAPSVSVVDSSTLLVETPAHAPGTVSVLVRDMGTNQSGVLASSFTFLGSGGGGCYMVPFQGPRGPEEMLVGVWWVLLVFAVLRWRARRARPGTHEA